MSPSFPTKAVDQVVDQAIAAQNIVGTEIIAARAGQIVYQRAAGFADREAQRPVQENEVFRLASMTKAVVSVAALALLDRGKLLLDDPVTRWLPDFQPKLPDGSKPVITLRHLMTHTSGLTYGFLEALNGPYHRLGISDGLDLSSLTLEQNIRRLASAPLLFEPGTNWQYSLGVDVLGAVLERVTDNALPELIHTLVTGPLAMRSTAFTLPRGTSIATAYADATPQPVRMDDSFKLPFFEGAIAFSPSRVFDPQAFASGGVGLVGTARDYLRFLEAVRTGGGGILRQETATAMTSHAIGELSPGPGFGFGLGVQVLQDPRTAGLPMPAGSWDWGGVYGNNFWVDPVNQLSVVVLTNTAVAGMMGAFPSALRQAVYGNAPSSN